MNAFKGIYFVVALLASASVLCGTSEAKKSSKTVKDKGKKLEYKKKLWAIFFDYFTFTE